jgi:hypothetical protein
MHARQAPAPDAAADGGSGRSKSAKNGIPDI